MFMVGTTMGYNTDDPLFSACGCLPLVQIKDPQKMETS